MTEEISVICFNIIEPWRHYAKWDKQSQKDKYCMIPLIWGFPCSSVLENPSANAGDMGDGGLIPGSGRSLEVGNGNPFQYSCLENSMDRGAWKAIVHGVTKELDTTEGLNKNMYRQHSPLRWSIMRVANVKVHKKFSKETHLTWYDSGYLKFTLLLTFPFWVSGAALLLNELWIFLQSITTTPNRIRNICPHKKIIYQWSQQHYA